MSESKRYLRFSLAEEEFAIPLVIVREVIGMPETTPVPQMPKHFVGIMNLRGSIISILDLRLKMGIKPGTSEETAVIILDFGDLNVGAIVDRVNAVSELSTDQISEAPRADGGRGQAHGAVAGVCRDGDNLILILDISAALSADEKSMASKVAKKAA
jgi:purine-binding chemotaxis protein CheW